MPVINDTDFLVSSQYHYQEIFSKPKKNVVVIISVLPYLALFLIKWSCHA